LNAAIFCLKPAGRKRFVVRLRDTFPFPCRERFVFHLSSDAEAQNTRARPENSEAEV
jgi:hypothetical protein